MALALYDRVKETTTTVGTGSVTLLGASTGFQSFAVVGNANTTYYCIADQGGANWEVGIGTYTASGTTLARTTVLSSSNADALVVFTAGIKDVFVTYPSSKGLWKDASGNAIGLGTPAAFVGTNITGTASGLTAGNVTTNANLTGAVTSTGNATSLGSFTSLQLATALTNETGTGSAVFSDNASLLNPTYTGTLTGSTGILNIGSGQVYKDASGNVGIGTTSPSSFGKLAVIGNIYTSEVYKTNRANAGAVTSGSSLELQIDGTTYAAIRQPAAEAISFNRGNGGTTETMRIDSSGNLLVGTTVTPSSSGLSVGSTGIIRQVLGGLANTSWRIRERDYVDSVSWSTNINDAGVQDDATKSSWSTQQGYGSGQDMWRVGRWAAGSPTFVEAMRIDSSGNVGIGTTNPSASIRLTLSDTNTYKLNLTGGSVQNAIRFAPVSTCKEYYVGAGINLLGSDKGFLIYNATDNVSKFYVNDVSGETRLNATTYLTSYTAGTERMKIDASGIITMSAYGAGAATFSAAGVISSVSDETWKIKDGVPVDADSMLKKLEPGYWFYNEEKAPIFGTDRQLGFYAQNVNEAIGPEAAPTPEEGKPWGYYDRSVLAVAVMSLQKALTTIEALTARLTALEAK